MKRYEWQEKTIHTQVLVESRCDGCGTPDADAGYDPGLFLVAIEVNVGEEFGRRDEYDYCGRCLTERAPLLVAAGSRSGLVLPEGVPEVPDA